MALSKLLGLKDQDELSTSDCAEINRFLSKINLKEIPENQRQSIEDYLITALNLNSVERDLVSRLNWLVDQLQSEK